MAHCWMGTWPCCQDSRHRLWVKLSLLRSIVSLCFCHHYVGLSSLLVCFFINCDPVANTQSEHPFFITRPLFSIGFRGSTAKLRKKTRNFPTIENISSALILHLFTVFSSYKRNYLVLPFLLRNILFLKATSLISEYLFSIIAFIGTIEYPRFYRVYPSCPEDK